MIASMPVVPHALATCALLTLAAGAGAVTVDELISRVERGARFPRPMRADVRITCEPACRTARAVLLARGDAVYVEVDGGVRALVRPGRVVVAENGRAVAAAPDRPLGDTALLLADLAVFDRTALRTPQISDEGPAEVVVTAEPTPPSPYALLVYTVDPHADRVVKTLYYQGSVGTLAKLRRDAAFVRVGEREHPGEIRIDHVRQASTTRLTLAWREAPDASPSVFEPAGLERPSPVEFPAS
jgi:hypothetical protein